MRRHERVHPPEGPRSRGAAGPLSCAPMMPSRLTVLLVLGVLLAPSRPGRGSLGGPALAAARMGKSRFKGDHHGTLERLTKRAAERVRPLPYEVDERFCGSDARPAAWDVTWATGGTFGRVDFLEFAMQRWRGPVAVAWYVPAPRDHPVAEAHRAAVRAWCADACADGAAGAEVEGCSVDVTLLYAFAVDAGMIPTNTPELKRARDGLGAAQGAKARAYAEYEKAWRQVELSEDEKGSGPNWENRHKEIVKTALDKGVAAHTTMYPINAVRNAALKLVTTDFVLQVDIDFVPSWGLRKELLWPKNEASLKKMRWMKTAADRNEKRIGLVIAPFEMGYTMHLNSWRHDPSKIPGNWTEMRSASKQFFKRGKATNMYPFHKGTRHEATNFKNFISITPSMPWEPYAVKPSTRMGYEAWMVMATKAVIPWDERYRGGAKDLSDLHMTLHGCGYTLFVKPGEFIVHLPHPTSSAQKAGPVFLMNWWTNNQMYRDKTRRTRKTINQGPDSAFQAMCVWKDVGGLAPWQRYTDDYVRERSA